MFETTVPLVVVHAVRYVWNYCPIGGDTLRVLCLKLPSHWWWYFACIMFETTIPLVHGDTCCALCLKLPSHRWWYFAVRYVWNFCPIDGDTCCALCLKLPSHGWFYFLCVMFVTTDPLVVILQQRCWIRKSGYTLYSNSSRSGPPAGLYFNLLLPEYERIARFPRTGLAERESSTKKVGAHRFYLVGLRYACKSASEQWQLANPNLIQIPATGHCGNGSEFFLYKSVFLILFCYTFFIKKTFLYGIFLWWLFYKDFFKIIF